MSKEFVGILALALTLVGSIFGFGQKLGTLETTLAMSIKTIDRQSAAIDSLRLDLQGARLEMIRIATATQRRIGELSQHEDEEDRGRTTPVLERGRMFDR